MPGAELGPHARPGPNHHSAVDGAHQVVLNKVDLLPEENREKLVEKAIADLRKVRVEVPAILHARTQETWARRLR